MSEAAKKRIQTPEGRAQLFASRLASRTIKTSKAELIVRSILDRLGISYSPTHRIGRYVADIFIHAKRLVVECDGKYWHTLPGAAESDARRDAYMTSLGYSVLRLPEKEIKEGLAETRLLCAIEK